MKKCSLVSIATIGILVAVLAGCRTVPVQHDFASPLEAALASVADQPQPEPGSAIEAAAIARFKDLLADLSIPNIQAHAPTVYAPDAWLNDTLRTVRGAADIRDYFLETAALTDGIKVRFDDVTRGSDGLYYFRWTMDVAMQKVARGRTVRTPGMSLVRFDAGGQVLVHQDYWDSTAGLFQHVPVLGRGIRVVKARL